MLFLLRKRDANKVTESSEIIEAVSQKSDCNLHGFTWLSIVTTTIQGNLGILYGLSICYINNTFTFPFAVPLPHCHWTLGSFRYALLTIISPCHPNSRANCLCQIFANLMCYRMSGSIQAIRTEKGLYDGP